LISVKSCHMDFLQKVHVWVGVAGFCGTGLGRYFSSVRVL
jgi:hypothetical protein